MPQGSTGPFHNRQPQAHAFGCRGTGVQAVELFENIVLFCLGYSRSGIPYLQSQHRPPPTRAHQYPAPVSIAHRIANQVLQNAPQIGGIAFDRRRACDNVKAEALMRGDRREFVAQLCKDLAKADRGDIDRSLAGFEFRDVEQAFSSVMPALSASASSETEAMNSLAAQSSCSRS